MKTLFIFLSVILFSIKINAQSFCFYDPNSGPIYNNGSSGAIYDVTTGDFNSDGHLDIVTANSVGSNISFIPGVGNGTLGIPDTTHVPGVLFCITSADFNNDTKLDIAVGNSGNVSLLFGNGNGTFQPDSSYPTSSASRLYAKDINNDNFPDLIEATQTGVFILINQGNGTFFPPAQYINNFGISDVTIGDFDNDAILDIVSTTRVSFTVSVLSFLKGNGNGTFAAPISNSVPDYSIFGINSEDIDHDGKRDLLVANLNNSIRRMEIYFGNGNGTFNAPAFYSTFNNPSYVYLADFNNDLINDIAVPEGSGFSLLKGNANATFGVFQNFVAEPDPNSLAIGDYNEDGQMDVIIPSAYFGLGYVTVNLNCTATGIENISPTENSLLSAFPNPFSMETILKTNTNLNNANLIIYNTLGQEIKTLENISGNEIKLERDNLSSGIYFIHLVENDKIIGTGKFMVE
jgi:hypothetical protein